jgi:hypothetical protein
VNVQVIADPAGRLIWASPALPGARHDAGAAREHGIPDALGAVGITAYADSAYHGLGTHVRAPFRRVRHDKSSRKFVSRKLSSGQQAVNQAIAAIRGPANAPTPKSRTGAFSARSAPARRTPTSSSTPSRC